MADFNRFLENVPFPQSITRLDEIGNETRCADSLLVRRLNSNTRLGMKIK